MLVTKMFSRCDHTATPQTLSRGSEGKEIASSATSSPRTSDFNHSEQNLGVSPLYLLTVGLVRQNKYGPLWRWRISLSILLLVTSNLSDSLERNALFIQESVTFSKVIVTLCVEALYRSFNDRVCHDSLLS